MPAEVCSSCRGSGVDRSSGFPIPCAACQPAAATAERDRVGRARAAAVAAELPPVEVNVDWQPTALGWALDVGPLTLRVGPPGFSWKLTAGSTWVSGGSEKTVGKAKESALRSLQLHLEAWLETIS